ncbi:VanW family protein [Patulibacter brassicae]|uniref:VanW family protein n=1 Tax=Patulibacter brassicae TaxID=1705717 RepID=A0ABU4VI95_9ACTN|nr:VanW family protein [Patulibacter brassicae]MDX8151513.1 VanW family protein [Patulibacter brassicae]
MAGVLVVLLAAALVARAAYAGKALPSVRVAGVDVGGADEAEIRRRIGAVLSAREPVRLTLDGRTRELRPSEAGYRFDLERTVQEALDAGRTGVLGGLPATLGSLLGTRRVPARITVDDRALRTAVRRIARDAVRDPFPGALQVDASTGAVEAKASRPGRAVNQARLTERVRAELLAAGRGPVEIPTRTIAAVPTGRLNELARSAERFLSEPLRITGAGAPLDLTIDELAPLVELEGRDGGRSARLGVDQARLATLLDRLAARAARPARDARPLAPATDAILTGKGSESFRPRSVDVRVRPGRPGRALRRDAAAEAIRAAVRSGRHAVRVPTATTQPKVTTAQARKVDQLIGSFTTPYVSGQPRVTNIRRMAATIDNTVIAPGATFSLNGLTGERTKAKGYVEAPFIAGNKIEPSVGGGVSQVSTTVYNAAYFAGLQLDAHTAHSLYIDRYPPGRESTLNFPDIDLRWTNDTDAPVLVRTRTTDGGITVTLYGHNGGRRVSASPGDRRPAPGGDFQITVTRTVRYADGRVVRQPVTTRYENEVESPSE